LNSLGCTIGKRSLIAPFVEFIGKAELMQIGESVVIETGVKLTVSSLSQIKPALSIGDETFIGRYCVITAREKVFIGKKVLIAPYCYISETNHGISAGLPIQDQDATWDNVHIEDGVWLGNGCTVLPGVRIGAGAVIGANSVVTKNIPANAIAIGSPARVIKYRGE
jgi:acetyltransferase-like isoleucine patch superfamily enzyme